MLLTNSLPGAQETSPLDLPFHRAVRIVPKPTRRRLKWYVQNLRETPVHRVVYVHEGMIISDPEYVLACRELGITPEIREWDGDGSIFDFVVADLTLRPRITKSQRAACAVLAESYWEHQRQAKERQQEGARRGGRTAGRGRPKQNSLEEKIPEAYRGEQLRDVLARKFGVNARYIQDAASIQKSNPKLFKAMWRGSMTLGQVKRSLKKQNEEAIACAEFKHELDPEAVDLLPGTPAEDNPRELARLTAFPQEIQRQIVRKIAAGEAKTVKEVADSLPGDPSGEIRVTALQLGHRGVHYFHESLVGAGRDHDYVGIVGQLHKCVDTEFESGEDEAAHQLKLLGLECLYAACRRYSGSAKDLLASIREDLLSRIDGYWWPEEDDDSPVNLALALRRARESSGTGSLRPVAATGTGATSENIT